MRYKRSKTMKYRLMARSAKLRSALPSYRTFSKTNLRRLLSRYHSVIIKPSYGYGGAGVIAVTSHGHDEYRIHSGKKVVSKTGFHAAYRYMRSRTRGKSHVVQRKINLAKVNNRPFDIRVMVQRNRRGRWVVTGKLAKVAGAGYIITNIRRSQGRVLPFQTAIRRSNIRSRDTRKITAGVHHISLHSAKHLQKYYAIRTVGLDIGLDPHGHVWIIEPNFHPDITLFRKLKDRSYYRTIRSLQKRK